MRWFNVYECEVVEDGGDLAPLEAEWAELQVSAPNTRLVESVEWARCCWRQGLGAKGKRLHLVVRQRGRLVALLPLLIFRRGPLRVAKPLACQTTEYCPLLMARSVDAVSVWTAVAGALRGASAIDALLLPNVRDESARAALLKSALRVREIERVPVHFLRRSAFASWDSYWNQLPHRPRSNVKRARKRLSELGEIRFEELTTPEARHAAWDWIVAHKRDWLVRKRLDHPFIPSKAYARFTRATLDISSPIGRRTIFALKLNGDLVAADLVNIDRRCLEMFVCAYDPAFAHFAPGNLLRQEEIRWAFANGLDYDWRLGDEPYKADWASDATTANTYVLARNCRGRLFSAYMSVRTTLAHRTPQRLRKTIRMVLRRLRSGG